MAGAEIKIQSTATYKDGIGQTQSVTSNEVIVIVAEKSGVSLSTTPSTLTVSPGGSADYFYILENTGNAFDSYTVEFESTPAGTTDLGADGEQVEIYYDANLNGQVDPGDLLLQSYDGTTYSTAVATPELAADDTAGIIVRVITSTSSATVGATDIAVGFSVTSDSDTTVTETRTGITAELSNGQGVLDYQVSASTEVVGAAEAVTFTLSGSNVGEGGVYGQAGIPFEGGTKDGVLIELDLSNGVGALDFDSNDGAVDYSAIVAGSLAPATGVLYYWDDGTNGGEWTTDSSIAIQNDVVKVALFLEDPADGTEVLEIGQEFQATFTFSSIPNISETSITFSGGSTFDVDDAGTAGSVDPNQVPVRLGGDTLSQTYTASFDPYNGAASTQVISNGADRSLFQHPAVTDNPAEQADAALALLEVNTSDVTDAQTRSAGEEVFVPLTITNLLGGANEDTYNVTVDSNSQASLIAIELLQSDGVTPLQDSNGDGIRDTGIVTSTGYKDIVARLIIDESASLTTATTIVLRATSSDGTTSDTTTINIDEILPAAVDVAIAGETGDQDSTSDDPATSIELVAGDAGTVAIDIQNVRTALAGTTLQSTTGDFDSYTLTAVTAGGLVVKFYEDSVENGTLDDSEQEEILNTGALSPVLTEDSNIFHQIAQVSVPESTAPGTYSVTVRATSTNNTSIYDEISFDVIVAGVNQIDLEPEVFATVVAGGNVVLSHTITNTGNLTPTSLEVSLSEALPVGYTAYWTDATGANLGSGTSNNDPGTYSLSTFPAANESVTVFLRVGVPSTTPIGTTLTLTVQAEDNAGTTDSVTDVIQVIAGNLELVKEQSTDGTTYQSTPITSLSIGDTIYYRTSFQNLGSDSLTDVIIYESIPEHTSYSGAAVTVVDPTGAGSAVFSTDGGLSWAGSATASDVTNIRVPLAAALEPGQSGTVEYSVIVE